MINITTSGGMITFTDTVTGLTKQIGQNRLWIMFRADTVNFLQVDIPTDGYDGTPFWSVRASNLTINGETYTIEQLKNGEGLSDLFTGSSFGYLIVDELPDEGEPNIIYLVYDDETGTYVEYLWLAQEQTWEELGNVGDVDLGNYYTKAQIDTILANYAETSDLATVATSGSYNDLSNKPVIPTVPTNVSAFTNDAGYLTEHQSLDNYYNKTQTDNLLAGKANTSALAGKQDTLVSGTNIKTINNQSLLGEGNINIEGGGGGTQVQSNWNETDTTSMAYIQNKPTNVSAFVNDANYLTQHQSLTDVFADVVYDSQTKHINFYGKGDTQHTNVLAYVDATPFVIDGMVQNVYISNGNLVITFNTDSGKQDIVIPLTDIFNPNNYYTKTEVDTALAAKANSSSLSTVATSGSYNDLSNKPTIPDFDYYSEETTQNLKSGKIDTITNRIGAKVEVSSGVNGCDITMDALGSDTETILELNSTSITANAINGYNTGTVEVAPGYMTMNFETEDYDMNGFRIGFDDQTGEMVIANYDGDDRVAMLGEVGDYLAGKQDTLTAGTGITITNNVISATGGSQITVDTELSSTSTNPLENRAIYNIVGDIEQALAILNGTAS